MDKTIRLATKDNQEKVLAILGGDEAAGGGGLVKQMKAAVQEGTSGLAEQVKEAMAKASGDGMVRYQQPTNMLEFYARPKGQGIATAWRDPVDQAFYDRYGLADSIWEKTIIVANQNHMPKDAEDGITYTHTSRNLYRVADGEDVDRGNWYMWNLDPTKKTYFRFFAYGAEGVCNSNPKNAYTYDPNMMGALIFGASKERLREFFRMSTGFGQAVRLGLGLTNEIVEGVNVAEFDSANTYQEFLANKALLNAATYYSNEFARSVYYTLDYNLILDFYNSAPKYHDEKVVVWTLESKLKNNFGSFLSDAVASSRIAFKPILDSETCVNSILSSERAFQTILLSPDACALIEESKPVLAAITKQKESLKNFSTLNVQRKKFTNKESNKVELAASSGFMVAISSTNKYPYNGGLQSLWSTQNKIISTSKTIGGNATFNWNFTAFSKLYVKSEYTQIELTYDHYTPKPRV